LYRFTFCQQNHSDYDRVNPVGQIHSTPKCKRLLIRLRHSYAIRQQQFEQYLFRPAPQFLEDIHLTRYYRDLAGPGLKGNKKIEWTVTHF
jgi:hypothetical protein